MAPRCAIHDVDGNLILSCLGLACVSDSKAFSEMSEVHSFILSPL